MVSQIKIQSFHCLRQYYRILGTYPPAVDNNRRFNLRNILTIFCYLQMCLTLLAFTMFKARKIVEFGLNYYGYVTEVMCMFVILSQIYQMADILTLIQNCEKFVESSESKW